MRSTKYLEMIREKYELKTDSAIAEKLGISRNAVSQYMTGKRVMDEETCLAVALALEIEPSRVLMAAGIDRAERTGQKSLWEVFSKRASVAATVLMAVAVVTLFSTPLPVEAAQSLDNGVLALCIM
ncbi:MAG: helix-turn-helix domain-containing protein [Burkholderiaceae bacterium]